MSTDMLDGDPPAVLQEMQAAEGRRYSLERAIRSALRRSSQGHRPDGFEREVSDEIAIRRRRAPRGWYVPLGAPMPERRIDDTTAGTGAVQTVWPPRLFIDVLRAKLVVAALGGRVTTFSAARGKVQVPVQTAPHATAWVVESASPGANTSLTVGSVTFVPHTIAVQTGVTRWMDDVGAPGFIEWLYDDLAKSIAVAVDAAAINGTAANNQPIGLLNAAGVPAFTLTADTGNGGAPSYFDCCNMEQAAANLNADAPADAVMGWLTSPNGRSKLRRTDISGAFSGTSGRPVWDDELNTVIGSRAMATTNCPSNLTKGTGTALSALIFGDWRDLAVNLFDAVDVLLNPYAITTSGFYGLYAYQEVDVQVLRPNSFQVCHAMVTT
jgi:HK97 family phage major capsid protein